jgi:diguanylate cyclase (GGDEF)-like protein
MPRLDGYELARRIRSNPATRFIPIIIQTAAADNVNDIRRGSDVGALGYITDPGDIRLLLSRARTLLDFKSYMDECEAAAFTDHLTGLANRRRFEEQLAREVARAARYRRPLCLLMADIDHFKAVNDTHGHAVGDQALRTVGETLKGSTRDIDLAARVGGEEFALLLPETEARGGKELAERLRLAVAEQTHPQYGRITVSFGIVSFPFSGSTSKEMLVAVDAALYEAKRLGRNRVVEFSSLNKKQMGA